MSPREEQERFERQVRHIASCLRPTGGPGNPEPHEGRERDAVFLTDDAVHIVEATVSRSKRKAVDDCKKAARLIESLRKRHPDKDVRGWLVTRDTPTSEQVGAVGKRTGARVRIVSCEEFCQRRLRSRNEHGFPEIFSKLEEKFETVRLDRFPVYVDPRDRWGRTDPSEVLERHARRIGIPYPPRLVRAWKAGLAVLRLDGFDEPAAEGWSWRKDRMRGIRREATAVVAALVRETPRELGIVFAGRSQYFDSRKETICAPGLPKSATQFQTGDFTEDEVQLYQETIGHSVTVPDRLPSRPSLLGRRADRSRSDRSRRSRRTRSRARLPSLGRAVRCAGAMPGCNFEWDRRSRDRSGCRRTFARPYYLRRLYHP